MVYPKEPGKKPFIADNRNRHIKRISSGYRRRGLRYLYRNDLILVLIHDTEDRVTPVARVCTAIGKRVMT